MSIQKDVEKMYRSDLEKQKQKQKKKNRKRLFGLLMIIIILVVLLLIMQYLGLGLGGGKGEGSGNASETNSKATEITTTTAEIPKEFYDIKVSGSTYIVNEKVVELSDFISEFSFWKDNVIVRITDDNATKNAMDDLKKALEDGGREYTETTVSEESALTDSTTESMQ